MGIAGKTSTMKGAILIALALLVASCQMKPAKHFLIETKTKTDDEPARKEEDYMNINHRGNHQGDNIHIEGGNHGNAGGVHWNNQYQFSQCNYNNRYPF